MNQVESGKKYLQYLPYVFHGGEDGSFVERYIKIFEKIISGIDDGEIEDKKGILEMLDVISDIYYPRISFLFDEAEKDFLPPLTSDGRNAFKDYFGAGVNVDEFLDEFLRWLAGWMALVLNEDWELEKKREVIARIIPIYRMRGTKRGLEEYLNIYVGKHIKIIDNVNPIKVGVTSRVGKGARVGGLPPYFFIVEVNVMHMFRWDNVPGSENDRLMRYLKDDFGLDWAMDARIERSVDGNTIRINAGKRSAEIIMSEKKNASTLRVDDGKSYELSVKNDGGELSVYNERNIQASHISKWRNKKKNIEQIIDSEKPAHTSYWLNVKHPRMTVGVNSRIGENTLL